MGSNNKELIGMLKEVLQLNVDSYKGYDQAADTVKSENLITYFKSKAIDRKNHVLELETVLKLAFGDLNEDWSHRVLNRTWMNMMHLTSPQSDKAILEESIRGDRQAIKEYAKILENINLPIGVSTVIRNQFVNISTDLNKIKGLEDQPVPNP
ncbi:uncharacterized protein (TIGR02284 family) [Flavobacteriaceae bacterium MAR_2009_75]|nr:uncharacterized protein (TIGR02284 family) [Flavobacteriaceae bacterium MAR_2009_75]